MSPGRWTLLAVVLATTVAVQAGCGGGGERLVDFTRSGGTAYTSEQLVIDTDGSATVVGRAGTAEPHSHDFDLSDAELEHLRSSLETLDPEALGPDPGEPCGDCLTYRVAAGGEVLQFTEPDLVASAPGSEEMAALVAELGFIASQRLHHHPEGEAVPAAEQPEP
jgi:hypothetical protein